MNNVTGSITQAMLDATASGDTLMLNGECRFANRLEFRKSGIKVTGAPGHKLITNPGIHAFQPHANDIEITGLEVDGLLWRNKEGYMPHRVNIHHNYFTFKKGPTSLDANNEWAGITWTDPGAMIESRVCNNVVRSCTCWAPFLFYSWQDLEVAYNEGYNIKESDTSTKQMRMFKMLCNNGNTPGGNNTNWSHGLWAHHNYCKDLHGAMWECQGGDDYAIYEDNYFEKTRPVGGNVNDHKDTYAMSLPLDRSRFAKIRRNYLHCVLPAGVPASFFRIAIECGGYKAEVYDNYIVGNGPNNVDSGNISVAVNGTGGSVDVYGNRIVNMGKVEHNNGSTGKDENNGPTTPLSWDINRPPPRAFGTPPIPPYPGPMPTPKPVVTITQPPLVVGSTGSTATVKQLPPTWTVTPEGSVEVIVKP